MIAPGTTGRTAKAGAQSAGLHQLCRRAAIWLGGFLFLCFIWVLPHWDWNQNARLDLTVAIVNHATFAIDRYGGARTRHRYAGVRAAALWPRPNRRIALWRIRPGRHPYPA